MNVIIGKQHFNNVIKGLTCNLIGHIAGVVFDSQYLPAFFGIVAWYYILKGLIGLRPVLKNPFSGFYRILFIFYIIQCVIMVSRGFLFENHYPWVSFIGMVNQLLFVPTYLWCYFMPIIALIPYQYYSFDKFIKYSIPCCIILIIGFFIFNNEIMMASVLAASSGVMENETPILSIITLGTIFGFTLLCSRYIEKKITYVNFVSVILSLIIAVICARRGMVFSITALLFGYFFITKPNRNFYINALLYVFLFALVLLLYSSVEEYSMFMYLRERGFEDTRSEVETSMLDQMTDLQKIFGAGLNGRYYYPLGGRTEELFHGYRFGIETGFYNLVLKGGYLLAVTYVLLLIIPALKGFFQSNNTLCKAGGFYILLSIAELYPFGLLSADVKFLVIWMCVVLCMSSKIRGLSNQDIYNNLFSINR